VYDDGTNNSTCRSQDAVYHRSLAAALCSVHVLTFLLRRNESKVDGWAAGSEPTLTVIPKRTDELWGMAQNTGIWRPRMRPLPATAPVFLCLQRLHGYSGRARLGYKCVIGFL